MVWNVDGVHCTGNTGTDCLSKMDSVLLYKTSLSISAGRFEEVN